MKPNMVKTISGWQPFDPETEEWSNKKKLGGVVEFTEAVQKRNPQFHRKYFALLHVGYDNWQPPRVVYDKDNCISAYKPVKNFKQFRENVAKGCGYYKTVYDIKGGYSHVADSISFASMEPEAFEDLYSKTIDLFLKHIYDEDMTAEEINNCAEQYMSFA